ncbi:hypothetical protein T01_13947, partial [Trichinella spiralis]
MELLNDKTFVNFATCHLSQTDKFIVTDDHAIFY